MKTVSISWLLTNFIRASKEELVSEDKRGFELRLRLQKAAYLLKKLKVEPFTNYEFNLYLYGPYSPKLAAEYFEGDKLGHEKPAVPVIDEEKRKLLEWFIGHDARWLEIASSILFVLERYQRLKRRELFSVLRLSKPRITYPEFEEIFRELKDKGLI